MKFKVLPEIISMSDILFDPVWAIKDHKSTAHELLHIIRGEVELTYKDGTRYLAGSGNTLFNPAGTLHRDVFDLDKELEIFIIHFQWEHSNDFFNEVDNKTVGKLSGEVVSETARIFDAMRFDHGNGSLDQVVAGSRLMNILLLMYRDLVASDKKSDSISKQKLLVAKAKAYIERHFREPLRLEDVARHLKVSQFYLSRIFGQESDFSLIEYLTEARLEEAKKLLHDGRYIVADVARLVGYEDSSYFAKVFKRYIGIAPSKYH